MRHTQVFKCSALEDGHICAIKKIKLDRRDTAAVDAVFNEIDLLRRFKGNPYMQVAACSGVML